MTTLKMPSPPTFASVEDERQHRKVRLAAAFRLFSRFGFDEGVAGHITARDPELTDHFWVNPFGMHFGHIRASDLCLVNDKGDVVEGEYHINQAAFAIHSQVHAARPDVISAAHSHSVYGTPWPITRRRSCATTACSLSGSPSTRRRGGSSPWNGPARLSSWPRQPARRF